MIKKAAIIIPTRNRSNYLIELLNYYASVKSGHTIYIGDASDPKYLAETMPVIESLSSRIDIVHKQYPELNRGPIDNLVTINKILEFVKEEYVVWSGDDDYYIPGSLDKCVDFLENNPGYSSAHGYGSFVSYDKSAKISRINGRYDVGEYEADSASGRLKQLMNSYSVLLFSIHRKEAFCNLYRNIEMLTHPLFPELTTVCLSSIQGKSKRLNELFLVRCIHDKRIHQPGLEEWFLDPDWHQSLQVYIRTLSEEIQLVDDIAQKDAVEVVKQAFSIYLKRSIKKAYCKREALSLENLNELVLQRVKMRVPLFIKKFVRNIILSFNCNQEPYDVYINTSGRLSKSSPYNLEFISVLSAFDRISKRNQQMVYYTKSDSLVNIDSEV